jgi:hypothetical protein
VTLALPGPPDWRACEWHAVSHLSEQGWSRGFSYQEAPQAYGQEEAPQAAQEDPGAAQEQEVAARQEQLIAR